MLADAMAALLEKAGQDEVEVLVAGETPHGHYDGAIVTIDLTDVSFVDRAGIALLRMLRNRTQVQLRCSAFVAEQIN